MSADKTLKTKTSSKVKSGRKLEVKSGRKLEVKSGRKLEVKSRRKLEVKSGRQPEVKFGRQPEVKPGRKPEVKPGRQPADKVVSKIAAKCLSVTKKPSSQKDVRASRERKVVKEVLLKKRPPKSNTLKPKTNLKAGGDFPMDLAHIDVVDPNATMDGNVPSGNGESPILKSNNVELDVEAKGDSLENSETQTTNENAEDPEADAEKQLALDADPYLLKDLHFHEANPLAEWTNKQRTMVLSTRGVTAHQRYFIEDIKSLLPHHRSEVKWDKKESFAEIREAADLHNCSNILFLEARRHRDLYLWMGKSVQGPSVKFQVLNAHTIGDTTLLGNHLRNSRPLLIFDKSFNEKVELKVLKELFVQVWGTPRFHPKSKPFHDHALCFFWSDNKIWFRNYQIFSDRFSPRLDLQRLIEVGPRFVLAPIRIFDGCFGGKTVWKSPDYITPRALKSMEKHHR